MQQVQQSRMEAAAVAAAVEAKVTSPNFLTLKKISSFKSMTLGKRCHREFGAGVGAD